MKRTYKYLLTTSVIWASFDGGTVQASNHHEAKILAEYELKAQLDKVNAALAANPETAGISIDMNFDEIEVELVTAAGR